MGQSLFERIQAKLELFRLEKRYTRRRHRRSTFVSNAIYVDGEYVYQTPTNTGSSTSTDAAAADALHGEKPSAAAQVQRQQISSVPASPISDSFPEVEGKHRLNRLKSMPGFGSRDSAKMAQRQSVMMR